MKRLIILPYAEKDINESITYFKEKTNGLEEVFIEQIDSSFNEILNNPEAFPIAKYDIRKFVINKFPFCIYYIERDNALYILAVFHDKRNPKDWYKRKLKN